MKFKFYTPLLVVLFSFLAFMCKPTSIAQKTAESVFAVPVEVTANNSYYTKSKAPNGAGEFSYYVFFPNLQNKQYHKLETVYFRNLEGAIVYGKSMVFSNLKATVNDIVMSNAPNAEYGNAIPSKAKPFLFKLKNNECVLSYRANGVLKYCKIEGLEERSIKE